MEKSSRAILRTEKDSASWHAGGRILPNPDENHSGAVCVNLQLCSSNADRVPSVNGGERGPCRGEPK